MLREVAREAKTLRSRAESFSTRIMIEKQGRAQALGTAEEEREKVGAAAREWGALIPPASPPPLCALCQVSALSEHIEKLMVHLKHESAAKAKALATAKQCSSRRWHVCTLAHSSLAPTPAPGDAAAAPSQEGGAAGGRAREGVPPARGCSRQDDQAPAGQHGGARGSAAPYGREVHRPAGQAGRVAAAVAEGDQEAAPAGGRPLLPPRRSRQCGISSHAQGGRAPAGASVRAR